MDTMMVDNAIESSKTRLRLIVLTVEGHAKDVGDRPLGFECQLFVYEMDGKGYDSQ